MPKPRSTPVTMLVRYHPKKGKEREVEALVARHWPTLARLGLVTDEPAELWRARDRENAPVYFVERFSWKDARASDLAHQTPEVMAIWEPMEAILERLELTRLEPFVPKRGRAK